jgi:hypothetical protein
MLSLILLLLLVLVGFPAAAFGVQLWLESRYDRAGNCRGSVARPLSRWSIPRRS